MQARKKHKTDCSWLLAQFMAFQSASIALADFQDEDYREAALFLLAAALIQQQGRFTIKSISKQVYKENKAFIIPQVSTLNALPDKIYNYLAQVIPASLKEVGMNLGMCSTTAYVAHAIKRGKVADNSHIELDNTLNEKDGEALLQALKVHCPMGLKISYDTEKISHELSEEMQKTIRESQIHSARLACITFQQGHRDSNHILFTVPQEMLEIIYTYVYPFPEEPKKQAHFARYAASRPMQVMMESHEDWVKARKILRSGKCSKDLQVDHSSARKQELRISDWIDVPSDEATIDAEKEKNAVYVTDLYAFLRAQKSNPTFWSRPTGNRQERGGDQLGEGQARNRSTF